MLHAYRLISPPSSHAPAQLWEWQQPFIHHLILNARTFDRRVMQWYFEDWEALAQDNARIWETYYRSTPLCADTPRWEDWMPAYRRLIVEVQEIYEENKARYQKR